MESQSSATKYFILLSLGKKGMHGYELISELGRMTGKKPSPGQVYPVLKKMKSLGYLSVSIKMEGKRKVKNYALTSSGKKLFGTMSKRFDTMIRSALKEKIKTCAHCSCEIFSGAYSKKIRNKIHYFCCTSCAAVYMKKK